jgi:TolB-like protein/DNA-binding winged helix-turn-helix (wHTH) protein
MSESQYSFAEFQLDCASFELRRQGSAEKSERISLERIPMELLILLLERQGSVVTRQEIIERLWGKDVFVDTEHGINTAILKVRRALRENPGNPRFIQTVSGKGYRFVTEKNGQPETSEHLYGRTLRTRAPRAALVVFSLVALATVFFSGASLRDRWLTGVNSHPIKSLAVLPLVNLSNDPGQDYFADGITEVLTTDLGKISALRVISGTSAMQYKGTGKKVPEIARELNVDAIVEGTVIRFGSHFRITANLVQASPEKHLWAETYESDVGEAVALQGKVAEAVASKIQATLTHREQDLLAARRSANSAAQDFYFMGRFALLTGTAESSKKALTFFQQSIQNDPGYAPSYAGLAAVYANWIPGLDRPRDRMPRAREYAQKALELDNTLAEAHSVLGTIKLFYDWDWPGAESEFKQTMMLNPNHAWAHRWYSRGLVTQGRSEEAVSEANFSLAVDPSPLGWDYFVWVFLLAHRNDLASERAQKLVELAPNYSWGHWAQAQVLERQGKAEEAARESFKADELFLNDPQQIAGLKKALAQSGAAGYWKRKADDYKKLDRVGYAPPVLASEACLRVGDREAALQWLERGYNERDDLMINLAVEPIFDTLHSDPRFQTLIQRVGIPVNK